MINRVAPRATRRARMPESAAFQHLVDGSRMPWPVSQALRSLRHQRAVAAERDGWVIRYRLVDPVVADLLTRVRPEPRFHHGPAAHVH